MGTRSMVHRCGSSPLTRGKLESCEVRQGAGRLIPAHAGKTRSKASRTVCSTAHPRSRGENAAGPVGSAVEDGSSPLTRGKPVGATRVRDGRRLIPAHAGKTRRTVARSWRRPAHPRSRGENSLFRRAREPFGGSSPLTRGKRGAAGLSAAPPRLIPAHAGKTRTPASRRAA